mgnify:CR=1
MKLTGRSQSGKSNRKQQCIVGANESMRKISILKQAEVIPSSSEYKSYLLVIFYDLDIETKTVSILN